MATMQGLAERLQRLEDLVGTVARLHRKELLIRWGISKSTFHRWRQAGLVPEPIRIGGPLWSLAEIESAEKAGRLPRPMSA